MTRSFFITETTAFFRLRGEESRKRSTNVMVDIGHATNMGRRTALGATAFAGAGDGSVEVGVRARFLRWIGQQSSIELSPGVILSHEEPGISKGKGVGLIGQIAYNRSRYGGLAVQVYSVERTTERGQHWTGSYYTVPGGRDTGVMLGFKLGGKPGFYCGLAAGIAGLISAGLSNMASP